MEDEIFDFDCYLKVGEQVPDFEFDAYDPKEDSDKSLSLYDDFINKDRWVVLFFYPADFTFVCPTELEELAGVSEELAGMGVDVISFSRDTVFVHKAWHDNSPAVSKVQFLMGADIDGDIADLFGFIDDESGLPLRGTAVVDANGVLRAIEVVDSSVGRSASELVRKIKALKFVDSHPGNVCPASWNEGDDTLKPGMDLVGKI